MSGQVSLIGVSAKQQRNSESLGFCQGLKLWHAIQGGTQGHPGSPSVSLPGNCTLQQAGMHALDRPKRRPRQCGEWRWKTCAGTGFLPSTMSFQSWELSLEGVISRGYYNSYGGWSKSCTTQDPKNTLTIGVKAVLVGAKRRNTLECKATVAPLFRA